MTKDELKAKLAEDAEFVLPEDASEEDKKSYEEAKTELAKDAEAQEEKEKEEAEAKEKDEAEAKEKEEAEAKAKADEEALKGSEKFISKADHIKELNEVKSKMGVIEAKLRSKEVAEQVQGYVFSESNPNGVLLPKNKDAASKVLMAATPKIATLFTEFVQGLPKVSAKLFKEEGGDGADTDKKSLIDAEVDKIMKANEGMKYGEALKVVSRDKPELFKK